MFGVKTACNFASKVTEGVFDEITVAFLLVGHTHEDIDQMFSTVEKALYLKNWETPSELVAVIRQRFIVSMLLFIACFHLSADDTPFVGR